MALIPALALYARWADEMHAINKTLGVFTPNYNSKFSPGGVLERSRVDYWLTNLEVGSCAEVADFYWGLHGKGFKKGTSAYCRHVCRAAPCCIRFIGYG